MLNALIEAKLNADGTLKKNMTRQTTITAILVLVFIGMGTLQAMSMQKAGVIPSLFEPKMEMTQQTASGTIPVMVPLRQVILLSNQNANQRFQAIEQEATKILSNHEQRLKDLEAVLLKNALIWNTNRRSAIQRQ